MDDGSDEPFRLAPIKKIDIFRSILQQLDKLIEHLRPGDRLGSERELADQLGVSRVSVREALRALESMGKVEIRRNSGTFVAQQPPHVIDLRMPAAAVDETYLRQVAQVRAAIECEIVRTVAARPDADLAAIRATLDRTGHDMDTEASPDTSLDARFEQALGRESGNPILAEFQRTVHELWLSSWLQLGGGVAPRRRFHREHTDILAAIEAGNVDDAVELMARHVNPYDQPA